MVITAAQQANRLSSRVADGGDDDADEEQLLDRQLLDPQPLDLDEPIGNQLVSRPHLCLSGPVLPQIPLMVDGEVVKPPLNRVVERPMSLSAYKLIHQSMGVLAGLSGAESAHRLQLKLMLKKN